MRVLEFDVVGLLGMKEPLRLPMNRDLNILTGRNGAGKTSLLKLMWYIMSGNILIALREVVFSTARIKTDLYECVVHKINRSTCKIEWTTDGRTEIFEDLAEDGNVFENAEDQVNPRLIERGSSVFFPTFRRIEGGFTLSSSRSLFATARTGRPKNDVEEALVGLARKLSNEPHSFVSAISTADIVTILMSQFSELSEAYNNVQRSTSQEIIDDIKAYKSDRTGSSELDAANRVLDEIRHKIEQMEGQRESIMKPIEAVRELVQRLFKHSGINIGTRLSFGDAANAVNSDALSAGEKQMLSFICYNAFYKDSIILIDEPELSLHVDWQRQLFSILLGQQPGNQFIIATHSPFIYSKYPDKELEVDRDRGDVEVG